MQRFRYGPLDQDAKNATNSRQIGNQWDDQAPTGRIMPEWERQARTGRNQSSVHDVCKTTLACSTLGYSAAMLTMVNSVKNLTKSIAVAPLNNQNRTLAGQGT